MHRGVYIFFVHANVNFVPFVDIVAYGSFVHPGCINTGDDRATRTQTLESFVYAVDILKVLHE
jgi:hypothetical protein